MTLGRLRQEQWCRQEYSGNWILKQEAAHEYRQKHLLDVRQKVPMTCMIEVYIPPSGSRGFMLGDIFGLNAGLTRLELTLFLFFELRADLGSPLLPGAKAGLVGEEIALIIGLGLPDWAALADGVLSAPNLGVFRAESRGVS